ncbi:MAG: hypothetical protein AB1758_01205, partial [Candidatus Eremiobacterota bacterium]
MRGLSLAEVLLAMFLMALLLALSAVNLQGARGRATTRGLAAVVAETLRTARQKAVQQEMPVAVVLPSEGGTRPHSASLYLLEGDTLPRIARVQRFEQEYPGSVLFAGVWGAGSSRSPLLAFGQSGQAPDLAAWIPPSARRDYCFVFSPDGSVQTNGLAHYDGEYHLLVCAGVLFSGAGAPPGTGFPAPGPAFFSPTRVGEPWTVHVSPAGSVRVTRGVASASVAQGPALQCAVAPASPPTLPSGANRPPIVEPPVLQPEPNPETLPPGADVTVPKEGYVTVSLEASDPDGDELFCEWTATGGSYASSGEFRMRWRPDSGRWTADWHWRPPLTCGVGDRFTLEYRVRDARGAVTGPVGAAVTQVEIIPSGKIVFESRDGAGNNHVWAMNVDGAGRRPLTRGNRGDGNARLTPDGTMVVFATERWGIPKPNGSPGFITNIARMNADGSGMVRLTPNWGWDGWPSLSPDGTRVAYVCIPNANSGTWEIWLMNLDGTGHTRLASVDLIGALYRGTTCWSPDGTQVVFPKWMGSHFDLYRFDLTAGSETPMVAGPADDYRPTWTPDGWLIFSSNRGGAFDLYRMSVSNPSQITRLTDTPDEESPAFVSP